MCGAGGVGTRLPKIAALPRWRRMLSLPHRCLTASPSSCPVWRARAAANFPTSPTAAECQPPKDSTARGKKAMPCRLQSSAAPRAFLSKAKVRAQPGVVAAWARVAPCRGLTTVTSTPQLCRHLYILTFEHWNIGRFVHFNIWTF